MTDSTTLDTQLDAYSRRAARRGRRKPSTAEVLGYTAAAGGLAFVGGDAMGAIIHNTTGAVFSGSETFGIFSVDLDGVGGADWGIFLSAYSYRGRASHYGKGGGSTVADGIPAIPLAKGFVVGPSLTNGSFRNDAVSWYANSGNADGPFFNSTTGYLGLRFQGDTGTVGPQYAWVKVHFEYAGSSLTMNIREWAYDNGGAPIAVGDTGNGTPVPTPATPLLTLLGLGAMGVTAYRRRREEGLKRLANEAEGAKS